MSEGPEFARRVFASPRYGGVVDSVLFRLAAHFIFGENQGPGTEWLHERYQVVTSATPVNAYQTGYRRPSQGKPRLAPPMFETKPLPRPLRVRRVEWLEWSPGGCCMMTLHIGHEHLGLHASTRTLKLVCGALHQAFTSQQTF